MSMLPSPPAGCQYPPIQSTLPLLTVHGPIVPPASTVTNIELVTPLKPSLKMGEACAATATQSKVKTNVNLDKIHLRKGCCSSAPPMGQPDCQRFPERFIVFHGFGVESGSAN